MEELKTSKKFTTLTNKNMIKTIQKRLIHILLCISILSPFASAASSVAVDAETYERIERLMDESIFFYENVFCYFQDTFSGSNRYPDPDAILINGEYRSKAAEQYQDYDAMMRKISDVYGTELFAIMQASNFNDTFFNVEGVLYVRTGLFGDYTYRGIDWEIVSATENEIVLHVRKHYADYDANNQEIPFTEGPYISVLHRYDGVWKIASEEYSGISHTIFPDNPSTSDTFFPLALLGMTFAVAVGALCLKKRK